MTPRKPGLELPEPPTSRRQKRVKRGSPVSFVVPPKSGVGNAEIRKTRVVSITQTKSRQKLGESRAKPWLLAPECAKGNKESNYK